MTYIVESSVSRITRKESHFDFPFSHIDRKCKIQQFLEEKGFTLCIHERDFLAGESIPANIAAAINHSRRMIMVISRSVCGT